MQNNANRKNDEKSLNDSSKTTITTPKYNVFEDPALKLTRFISDSTFSLIASPVAQAGYKTLSFGLSSMPTIAFGLADGINKKQSAGQIFYNIVIDVSVGILGTISLPVYLTLLTSQGASYASNMKERYLQVTALNQEDEFERLCETGVVSVIALPNALIDGLRDAYPHLLNNIHDLASVGNTIKADYLQATLLNIEDEFDRSIECGIIAVWSIPKALIDAFRSSFQPVINSPLSLSETNIIKTFSGMSQSILNGLTQFNQELMNKTSRQACRPEIAYSEWTAPTQTIQVAPHLIAQAGKNLFLNNIYSYHFHLPNNPYIFNHALMNILDKSQDHVYFHGQSMSNILNEVRHAGIKDSIFNVSSNLLTQYQSGNINPQLFLMKNDNYELPVHGKFSVNLDELRFEFTVPLLEAGKTGNPLAIGVAAVLATILFFIGKKKIDNYKLLRKKIKNCEKHFKNIQKEMELINQHILQFSGSGKLEPSFVELIHKKQQFLNKTLETIEERYREVSKLQKLESQDKNKAMEGIDTTIKYCENSIKHVHELEQFFKAYQSLEENNYQACLNYLNSLETMASDAAVKNLKFESYLKLNDLDSARKILPELSQELQPEYQEKLHILDIKDSLDKIKAIMADELDQFDQKEAIVAILHKMDVAALNLKASNQVLYYHERANILDKLSFDEEIQIANFQKIQELEALNEDAIKGLTKIYVHQQQWAKAIEEFEKIAEQSPEYNTYLAKLKINLAQEQVRDYVEAKNFNDALETLDRLDALITDGDDRLLVSLNKGDIHLLKQQALEEQADSIKNRDNDAYLLKMQEAKIEESKAIQAFQMAQEISKDNEKSAVELTKIHIKNNDLISAIEQLSKIQTLDKSYATQLQVLQQYHQANELVKNGQALIKNKSPREAVKKFKEAQALVKEHIPATLALAEYYLQQGEFDQAIYEMNKVPGADDYLADIKVTKYQACAAPFLRALHSCAQNHLHHDQMNQALFLGLKIFSAWYHVHPQSLVCIMPMLLAKFNDNSKALQAYQKSLSGYFEPFNQLVSSITELYKNYGFRENEQKNKLIRQSHDAFFWVNNVVQGLNVFELDYYIPYLPQIESMLGFAQKTCMTYQFADDINLIDALRTNQLGQINIANINSSFGYSFLMSYLKNTTLDIYDYFFPGYSNPETQAQCLFRELIALIGNALPFGISKTVYPWTVSANLFGIGLNLMTGHYKKIANLGRLVKTRQMLLQDDPQLQQLALLRYDSLTEFATEKQFIDAIMARRPVAQITFSSDAEPRKVDAQLAHIFLSKVILSTDFQHLDFSVQNSYLLQIKTIAQQHKNGNLHTAFFANRTYALKLMNMGYLFAAEEAMEKAIELAGQIINKLPSLTLFQYLTNMASFGYVNYMSAKDKFQEALKKDNLENEKNKIHQHALGVTSNKIEFGFGTYLMSLIKFRVSYALGLKELEYELILIKALSVLFADKEQTISFDGQKIAFDYSDSPNYKNLLDELMMVKKLSDNIKLRSLATCLHHLLTGAINHQHVPILMNIRSDKIGPKGLGHVAEDFDDAIYDSSQYDFIQYFLDLIANREIEETQLENINQQFMQELPEVNLLQFNYSIHPNILKYLNLVEVYLSAMIGFSNLFQSFIDESTNNTMLFDFKNEILTQVLMRGYHPPIELMMTKVLKVPHQISIPQAMALLELYDLNSNQACMRIKFNNLVSLFKASISLNSGQIQTLGKLYELWGHIVRASIFKDAATKTATLFTQIERFNTEEKAVKFAKDLLKQGADPNCKSYNISLLHHAVRKEWPKLVQLLCQYGHQLDTKNYDDVTPLQLAVIQYRYQSSEALTQIKKILVEYGSNTNKKTQPSIWYSPVWWSFYAGKTALDLSNNTLNWSVLSVRELPEINQIKALTHVAQLSLFTDSSPPSLERMGFRKKLILPNGNCLYASIAFHLNTDQQNLRHLVADYLTTHQEFYEGHISSEDDFTNFQDYVRGVRHQQWGGEVEIEILSKLIRRPIIVVQSDMQLMKYNAGNCTNEEPIFIYYNGVDHYDALEPTDEIINNHNQSTMTVKAI